MIGFDTEYQNKGARNEVLSYQYYACDLSGQDPWEGLYYPDDNQRLEMRPFICEIVTLGIKQQCIKHWPARIYLIGHFSVADLPGFDDFEDLKSRFDSIRRTFVTVLDGMEIVVWDANRHQRNLTLVLRDSMLLAPGGKQSLKALGELVGLEKIQLAEGEIENMKGLLAANPKKFEEYALRDPKVAVLYCLRILKLNRELFGEDDIPPTLSTIGVNFLLKTWEGAGIDKHAVLGTEEVTVEQWRANSGHTQKRTKTVPTAHRHCHESHATECYHGGRNEQYFFGASEEGIWTDYDLAGAYTTAMSLIGLPVWQQIRPTRDLNDFQPQVLGYAWVKFRFPQNTRFPCLPVRADTGLVFPLEGESWCCAPEIYLAQSMGAQLEIKHGVVLPADFNLRPFETFIIECTKRRKSFAKKSLDELFWKEIGNGSYGKTAQGLRKKRVFNTRTGEHKDLPPSKITNPFISAYVTSFIRGAVGEILARLPRGVLISNVTTDGFLSTATKEEAFAASQGPICRLFAAARLSLCGNADVLESKHEIHQVLGTRTRGQATLKAAPGKPIVLAKAGLKAPMADQAAQNEWFVDLFINRTVNTVQTLKLLRTLPDIHKNGGDLVSREVMRRVSMEFDWKRRPLSPSTRPIGGHPHLFFETAPWRNLEEFQACRNSFAAFAKVQGGVLKTEADLASFNDYRAMPTIPGIRRLGREASLDMAKRMFLRAYVRSMWGLDAGSVSYSDLARWLTSLGYPTKKSDVENANRPLARLVERSVVPTKTVEIFLEQIRERFPGFDSSRLLTIPPETVQLKALSQNALM